MPDDPVPNSACDPSPVYLIRVRGQICPSWTDWFEGLEIDLESDGQSLLKGPVADQAALFGILRKIRDLGLPLVSINEAPTKGRYE